LRGENRDLPIPVHIQKDPPFWDIFPENPEVFNLVLQARALGVLRVEENRALKETLVRYTRRNAIGSEDVDLAASWEETVQVLEIPACRNDREEIQRQVNAKLAVSETEEQKRSLYLQLTTYLQQRETELAKEGGKDSFSYKREYRIILEVIAKYKLNVGGVPDVTTPPAPVQDSVVQAPTVLDGNGVENNVLVSVFCTSCSAKNPASSNFCFKCGTKLVKMT
jgi:ribosomal protein L40E